MQVSYVFSDKTGTLTSNEMQLRQIAIGGAAYGSLDYRCVLCHVGLKILRLSMCEEPLTNRV